MDRKTQRRQLRFVQKTSYNQPCYKNLPIALESPYSPRNRPLAASAPRLVVMPGQPCPRVSASASASAARRAQYCLSYSRIRSRFFALHARIYSRRAARAASISAADNVRLSICSTSRIVFVSCQPYPRYTCRSVARRQTGTAQNDNGCLLSSRPPSPPSLVRVQSSGVAAGCSSSRPSLGCQAKPLDTLPLYY